MCGIVGIYSKSETLRSELGRHMGRMLVEMGDRGPDSAGIAVYRDPAPPGCCKLSLHVHEGGRTASEHDWGQVAVRLEPVLPIVALAPLGPRHALLTARADADAAQATIEAELPSIEIASAGTAIEIYKEAIAPARFVERFGVDRMAGTHALAHTRMATESKVTTAGSHPFSTGMDLCLVHNGSLSNHNRLREELRREGIRFHTDNDTEVAAGYLTWRLREGATLEQALEGCLDDLDGFYTFAVGTIDGFAVLRDPIACKPAVMAETDDWVAMASEYRAIACLPGAGDAHVWEPEPATVYSWGTAAVPA